MIKVTYLSGLTATIAGFPKGEAVAKEVKAPSLTAISMKVRSNQSHQVQEGGIYVYIQLIHSLYSRN